MRNGGNTTITIPGTSLSAISSDDVWQIIYFTNSIKQCTEIIKFQLDNIHIKAFNCFAFYSMWYYIIIKTFKTQRFNLMESESILASKPFYICLNTKISSPLKMLAPFFSFSHWEFSGNVQFCLPRTKRSLKVGASQGGVENSTVNRAILQHPGNNLLHFPCSNLTDI